jgi:DNA-binding CsgD family transcriptional regulator
MIIAVFYGHNHKISYIYNSKLRHFYLRHEKIHKSHMESRSTALNLDEIEHQYYSLATSDLLPDIEQSYARSTKDSIKRGRSAFLLGAFLEDSDYVNARNFYLESYAIAKKLGNDKLLSDALHGKAVDAFKRSDFKKANKFEEHALSIAVRTNHYFRISVSCYMLGVVASLFGAYDHCANFFLRSLQLAQANEFIKLQIKLYIQLGDLYLLSHELGKAEHYFEQAHALASETLAENDANVLLAKRSLATIELELKKYGEVTKLVTEVRKSLPKENHSLWCVTHTLMGKVHEAKRRYDKAETEFRTALSLADYVNAERVRSNVHTHLAELYLKTKKPKLALKEALAAVADAEKAQDAYVRKEALRSTHECYKLLGKYKQAHDYLEQYNALVAESDTALLKSRLEYHALKNDYELEKVKSETQTKKSELLRIKLDYKERELTEKIRHLIKQAEAVRQFRNDLRSLVRRTPADDPSVKDIRARLAAFPENEVHWNEFEKDFLEVHPEFLQSLSEKFPDLTKMERRIAAMIRMDLKSADIARLFSITERAVEFHRLNLRKKLRLKKGEELTKYLSTI